MMGQVNGESTIEQKTMTVTGVPVKKAMQVSMSMSKASQAGAGRDARVPTG